MSLATSVGAYVSIEKWTHTFECLTDKLTLVGLLGSGGTSTLDRLRHVVCGVPVEVRSAQLLQARAATGEKHSLDGLHCEVG